MKEKPWTTREVAELRRLDAEGLSNTEIAKTLNRSKNAVACQKHIHGIRSHERSARNYVRWRRWEDDLLERLPRLSVKQIADRLGRTEEAVKHRIKILRRRKKNA